MAKPKHEDTDYGDTAPAEHAAGADHEAEAPRIPSQRTPEERARMAANSIGAQIVLDYNSPAGIGARGGAGGTIEENTMARDRYLVALGLDPNAPSGPPPLVPLDQLQPPPPPTRPALSGRATRMSSLATADPEPLPAVPDDQPAEAPPSA
jgi:hypothetical protein